MNDWIPANERLPPERNEWNSCWWLVRRKGKIPTCALYINDMWMIEKGEQIFDVMHWMALPSYQPILKEAKCIK